ncbi:MAG: hypothetical protein UX49_C0049G0004 [Candidatus Wolfebacteria bacterium GW2011_GWC2_46_275]|uniref:Uncharacterized protein n=2 Tax=Candidatus Wolfeibacteriota TaxID=1752735 RepID=A0A0G1WG84_9BACT|nr:MAG: hypothetical protein UX49_C0049G0004 [Candidatus Wolfebacteria bacterium GW2011_GWC2_46_275]KKU41561.1 MAG: hypothetical protein UX58_C0007G0002 [Candidatus Wolfebacteria bacterium GW2011_GWB2_46_69]KKU53524.1 MAG: hypothetical protein UX76_C0014G0020 [Candidatus Wolfebacteria bacterium GW2011_GWC1_47_103]KKU59851.1 MAG: hypothetical protein UX83_C0002G0138 [Candidatus Wolfebacteria bacterium GW2011_GWE2_47_12]KKU65843.1 MAG: hypothetical protein UX90_C0002G0219 [Candidatus Wolfebacteri
MDIFLVYLFDRFVYRISHFIRHWYVDSFMSYSRFIIARLEEMDQSIALKVTWRNIFQPLYQEYNIFGYVLGFIFRAIRLVIGSVLYAVVIGVAAVIFLAWAGIPIYVLLKIAGQTPAAHVFNVNI